MIIGMTATPVLVGLAFDIQGTYKWAFLITATTCFIGAGLILFARRPIRPPRGAYLGPSGAHRAPVSEPSSTD